MYLYVPKTGLPVGISSLENRICTFGRARVSVGLENLLAARAGFAYLAVCVFQSWAGLCTDKFLITLNVYNRQLKFKIIMIAKLENSI